MYPMGEDVVCAPRRGSWRLYCAGRTITKLAAQCTEIDLSFFSSEYTFMIAATSK